MISSSKSSQRRRKTMVNIIGILLLRDGWSLLVLQWVLLFLRSESLCLCSCSCAMVCSGRVHPPSTSIRSSKFTFTNNVQLQINDIVIVESPLIPSSTSIAIPPNSRHDQQFSHNATWPVSQLPPLRIQKLLRHGHSTRAELPTPNSRHDQWSASPHLYPALRWHDRGRRHSLRPSDIWLQCHCNNSPSRHGVPANSSPFAYCTAST